MLSAFSAPTVAVAGHRISLEDWRMEATNIQLSVPQGALLLL